MIARLRVLLPFVFSVRQGDSLPPHEYDKDGYRIKVFPPYLAVLDPSKIGVAPLSENIDALRPADPQTAVDILRMDSSPTIQANCLQVYLQKADFDRRRDVPPERSDPSSGLLFEIVDSFITRYRSGERAPFVKVLTPGQTLWHLRYLQDDETELAEDPALKRGFGGSHFGFRLSGLNRAVWDRTWALPADYQPRGWKWLLLDAEALLPEVGPSIVVVYSALETFVTWALDQLAARTGLPTEMWSWINNRGGDHEKEPSVEERFDVLLKILAGRSLKEEARLWEPFKNLRTIRNRFSHEGRPVLGGREVTVEEATQFIGHAKAIVEWVENLLPADLRRPSSTRVSWYMHIPF